MENPYPRPILVPEESGIFIHYSASNVYGIRFPNLYEEDEPDNWLITEIRAGRYKLYKVGNSNLFQAIKQTNNRSEREIIELTWRAEIDMPLVEGQLTIPDGAWTIDEYPGIAEHIRWDPMPAPRLLTMANLAQPPQEAPALLQPVQAPFNTADALAYALLEVNPARALARRLLHAAQHVEHRAWYDLGDDTIGPITAPLPLLTQCSAYQHSSITPPQKRIAEVMIADAIAKEEVCSITMNPITPSTAACVAPCYHVFDKEAIQTWLATKHTCPTCRAPCAL